MDIILLGIATHIKQTQVPYPHGQIDIGGLGLFLNHIIYPVSLEPYQLVLLINDSVVEEVSKGVRLSLKIESSESEFIVSFRQA